MAGLGDANANANAEVNETRRPEAGEMTAPLTLTNEERENGCARTTIVLVDRVDVAPGMDTKRHTTVPRVARRLIPNMVSSAFVYWYKVELMNIQREQQHRTEVSEMRSVL